MNEDARVLCTNCVNETVLKAWMDEQAFEGTCSFCEKHGQVLSFSQVAKRIDEVIREHYAPASAKPHSVDWSENTEWWTEGTDAAEVIAELAEIDSSIAEEIESFLSAEEQWAVHREGAFPYYGDELDRLLPYGGEFLSKWIAFEKRLMHEVRFFDETGRAMLDELLFDTVTMADGRAVVEIEPDSEFSVMFRARATEDEAEKILKTPSVHLGPPPPEKARAGRMNPFGISVFYGAFSAAVAVAEIRPPVGAWVAVGKFKTTKKLKLLDFSFFPFVRHQGSLFSPEFGKKSNKARFLQELHRRISRAVLPNDEARRYLPTQAVAAYVANVLKLDGIIYESQQVDTERDESGQAKRSFCNIVLFGAAAKVEQPPQGEFHGDAHDPFFGSQFATTAPGGLIVRAEKRTPESFTLTTETPTLVKVVSVSVSTTDIWSHVAGDGTVTISDREDYQGEDD